MQERTQGTITNKKQLRNKNKMVCVVTAAPPVSCAKKEELICAVNSRS